jgi:hypothetical protein
MFSIPSDFKAMTRGSDPFRHPHPDPVCDDGLHFHKVVHHASERI